MASDLPSEFDVVVLGTGLPESILAAAFSRNGYKVLHLDRNDYYSSGWASFNVEGVEKWKKRNENGDQQNEKTTKDATLELRDGERLIALPQFSENISNITTQYHVPDEVSTNAENDDHCVSDEADEHATNAVASSDSSSVLVSPSESETPVRCEDQFEDKEEENVESEKPEKKLEMKNSRPLQKMWTASEIKDNWRRFNLDLAPKVLYSSGNMVELLIVSDVAKYCEFRTVSQILTFLNGQLEKVPCSRADVFGSKKVSMLEKRLLMKFLTFCAEYDKHPEQYQDYIGKPFSEFLNFKKLTPNTHHFVYHSIAMATETTTTEEGLKKTQHFLQSLGRYGNTAFLFPLYGSGEIPQGFCRLCAVFGGVYCLQMSATHMITDQDNKCCAIYTTEGQRIDCKHLILGPSYIPDEFQDTTDAKSKISRAILVTNKSVLPTENLELSMMHLLPGDDPSRAVTMLELPPSSMVCPRDSFVVHLTRKGNGNPEAEFSETIQSLFKETEQTEANPCILWSLFFTQIDQSVLLPSSSIPSNVHLLPGPGAEIDMDGIVEHARNIWEIICPDEDFLPKPPNPEDIIYVDDAETKVGEGTENAFEDASEKVSGEETQAGEKDEDTVTGIGDQNKGSGPANDQNNGGSNGMGQCQSRGQGDDENKSDGNKETEQDQNSGDGDQKEGQGQSDEQSKESDHVDSDKNLSSKLEQTSIS